ncbi:hypothetical protein DKX38_006403 [Salix brachista]|uniref:26S proteasome non-ATPase regulatory subunit 4 homolog n=1 Tax=Salix brachista TaxID=2182728 RepID=A0A5N5N5G2_9ROSI|nr:hypothetical protein DKX38_006403 [Salix brachista]
MGSKEEADQPTSPYDSSSPSQPLLFKPPSTKEPNQADQPESDPTQYLQISYNYGPRPFKDLPFLILFVLVVLCTFGFGIFCVFHKNPNYSNLSSYTYELNSSSCVKGSDFNGFYESRFDFYVLSSSGSGFLKSLIWTLVVTLILSVPICFLLLLLLKHYTKQIVYVSLPFFIVIPIFLNVYWFVACTLSSSCTDAFPLVYRILVFVFVFLIIGVIVWVFVANWRRIELTVKIIGVASDALSKNLGLFVVIPLLTLGLVAYYVPIVVFLVFGRLNGKIVPKESNGEYTCAWKQDSWVPAYYTLAILAMLWSLTVMVEAQVYVIGGTIAQWYFTGEDSKPRRSIRSSLRNAFGPSSGTVCLSGLLICVVRIVRAAVDSARQEDVPGMVNLVLRCCVKALLSAVDFLNKFTINFAAITGEAYCTSARMTYELLKRNLLSAVFVETVSTRLLAGIAFILSSIYAIVVCAILKGASNIGVYSYAVAVLAWVLLIIVLGSFVNVLDNVIETVYICYAIDSDRGEVYRPEVHEATQRAKMDLVGFAWKAISVAMDSSVWTCVLHLFNPSFLLLVLTITEHSMQKATMICIDNSEWMRNGDYSPSRFQAQADAVNLLCGAKTQSNPENTVGILTMAGKQVRVLTTPTSDLGKILSCMHGLEVGGEMNLSAGIQVAQLALKHRQNKNQQQRIIVFAGSPIQYDKKMLETIGKKLKKNNVSLDIVDFGEDEEGKLEKLDALFAAVNSNESSHIIHIPPGGAAISTTLMSTPVFTGDGEGGSGFAAAAAAGGGDFDFGVDPNLDPELALALRVSMEEERARQEAAAKRAADEAARQEKGEEPPSNSPDATMVDKAAEATNNASEPMDEVNALLQQAIALSMENSGSDPSVHDSEMAEATNEDQDLARALQISIQEAAKDSSSQSDMSKVLEDPSFMPSVLASLPGVDPNDPSVKELLASLQGQSEDVRIAVIMLLTLCNGTDVFVLWLALWLLALGRKQWLDVSYNWSCYISFLLISRSQVFCFLPTVCEIMSQPSISLSGSFLDRVNNSRSQIAGLCSEVSKQCGRGAAIASKTE